MTKFVVFSSNLVPAYAFMAPITAMVWKARTEFTPVCLLTQNRETWDTPMGRVVVDMLDRLEVRKHYVGIITEPYRTSVQAQASRQHAAALKSFKDDDYIMTTDVDGIPVNREWHGDVDWSKPCHIRNANAWQYRWHTTFGFGATVAAWREFMGYEACGEIAPLLQKNLDLDLTRDRDSLEEWYSDEFLWNSRIKTSHFWKDGCQFIDRNVSQDRIDRGNWPKDFGPLHRYIDAHVLRPTHSDENWERTRPLLERLVSENQMGELCLYRERFMSALS